MFPPREPWGVLGEVLFSEAGPLGAEFAEQQCRRIVIRPMFAAWVHA